MLVLSKAATGLVKVECFAKQSEFLANEEFVKNFANYFQSTLPTARITGVVDLSKLSPDASPKPLEKQGGEAKARTIPKSLRKK
ncbi:MAG: hypothetical protein HRF49_06115 [bacterium]